jgi:hypothetical protein
LQLLSLWINRPGMHIDHSWQSLWPSNRVFFHRPQIFHQKAGYSNQRDVTFRDETPPFD